MNKRNDVTLHFFLFRNLTIVLQQLSPLVVWWALWLLLVCHWIDPLLLHRESNNIKLQSCLAGGGGQLAVDPEKLKEKEFDLGLCCMVLDCLVCLMMCLYM